MPKVNTQTINRFLIPTSIVKNVSELTTSLTFWGRQAYTNKEYSRLSVLTKLLRELDHPLAEEVGSLYHAFTLSRQGQGDIEKAHNIFFKLVDSQYVQVRAASKLALGITEYQAGNLSEASKIILEANALALSRNICAPVTAINAQNALSQIQGLIGNTQKSLDILSGIEPIARKIGCYLPAVLGEIWNNYAYGYYELGNLKAASHYINKALKISISIKYTTWAETQKEIEDKIEKQSRKISSYVLNPSNGSNIHIFPEAERRFVVELQYSNLKILLCEFFIDESAQSSDYQARLSHLLSKVDYYSSHEPTGAIVRGYHFPPYSGVFDFERQVKIDSIYSLALYVLNLKSSPVSALEMDQVEDVSEQNLTQKQLRRIDKNGQ